jgi:hypothetical protein
MNAQQRRQLRRIQKAQRDKDWALPCPRCGQPGKHWSPMGGDWLTKPLLQREQEGEGFWSCDDMFDESGRRKEPQLPSGGFSGLGGIGLSTVLSLAILGGKFRRGEATMTARARAEADLAKDVARSPDLSRYTPEELQRNPIGF